MVVPFIVSSAIAASYADSTAAPKVNTVLAFALFNIFWVIYPVSVLALKSDCSAAEISRAEILKVPDPASPEVKVKVSAVAEAIFISIARFNAEVNAAFPIE